MKPLTAPQEEILTLAIQAGGGSKRMGQDKALLPFAGKRLVEFIVERAMKLTNDILVTTNHPEDYQFLHITLASDLLPQHGALIGIHTALSTAKRSLVAVIGCDMPFFSPQLLAYQAQLLEESEADAIVPRSQEFLEPLHGVYKRVPCLEAIQQALDMKIHSLSGWLNLLHVIEISDDQIRPFDPDFRIFMNLNTPEEYHQAEALIDKNSSNSNTL